MTVVNVHEAKTQLSKLIERAAAGEEIVIARAGRPVCRLAPLLVRPAPRVLGQFRGQPFSVAPDFDELPEDLARRFEGDEP